MLKTLDQVSKEISNLAFEVYDEAEHQEIIIEWLELRGMSSKLARELPRIGVVAFKGEMAIAAGFVRQCEGSHGMVDSLISNPKASKTDRFNALDIVIAELLEISREVGLKQLVAYSVDKNTIMRAYKHGFMKSPHTVLVYDLNSSAKVRH